MIYNQNIQVCMKKMALYDVYCVETKKNQTYAKTMMFKVYFDVVVVVLSPA